MTYQMTNYIVVLQSKLCTVSAKTLSMQNMYLQYYPKITLNTMFNIKTRSLLTYICQQTVSKSLFSCILMYIFFNTWFWLPYIFKNENIRFCHKENQLRIGLLTCDVTICGEKKWRYTVLTAGRRYDRSHDTSYELTTTWHITWYITRHITSCLYETNLCTKINTWDETFENTFVSSRVHKTKEHNILMLTKSTAQELML